MPPDEPNDEERLEELPQDQETPFQPADPEPSSAGSNAQRDTLDSTHPSTDTNIQPEELYDEGVSGAAESADPNSTESMTDYYPYPEEDQENQQDTDNSTSK